jgi:hypothetical protein
VQRLAGVVVEGLVGGLPSWRAGLGEAVDLPGDAEPDRVGDGGEQVDVLPVAVVDPALVCPGALMSIGTHISWAAFPGPRARPPFPGVNPSPWSAVMTTSDLSYRPWSLSRCRTRAITLSVKASWIRCRWWFSCCTGAGDTGWAVAVVGSDDEL